MAGPCKVKTDNLQANLVASIIPPLNFDYHKGTAGRIGVIGGCKEYSGAPYFAAISALKVGCDLSHVFCYNEASQVIKGYSPDLIVHPVLDSSGAINAICGVLPRLHALVIGPGLGRNESDFRKIHEIIDIAKSSGIPIVLDADALYYVSSTPEVIRGYRKAILTPNVAEYKMLAERVLKDKVKASEDCVKRLAQALGNVTVVLKGRFDLISDGELFVECKEEGGPRRCGGQGDLLSGSLGVFSHWSHQATKTFKGGLSAPVLAALGACLLTKRCNKLAFIKHSRSMTTSDMIEQIQHAFAQLYPSVN